MEFNISWPSSEEFAELVALVRSNHAEVTAILNELGVSMANATDVLKEVAAGLRGPLATSVLDLIRERDQAEAARVDAVNALAVEQGREATEEAEESAAAADLRDAFGEVAGLFDDPDLPDVEPLPEPDPIPAPPADETPVDPAPAEDPTPADETPVQPAPEEPTVDPAPPADEPVPAPEQPADETPVEPAPADPAPADEPVDDGSGAIVPPAGDNGEGADPAPSEPGASDTVDPAPNPGESTDAPSEPGAADSGEVAPNPGAEAEQQ